MIVDALCAVECGDVSPLLKARPCPRSPKWVLLSARLSGNQSGMNWPHAPAHWMFEPGLYIVTTGTYRKLPHLNSPPRLDLVQESLFKYAHEFAWNLRAWAVLANHYHFVAASPSDPGTLRRLLGKLHMQTAKHLNRLDNTPGRTVWFSFGIVTSHSSARISPGCIPFIIIQRGTVSFRWRKITNGVRPPGSRRVLRPLL
jgi:REP element-mobilizing transposase RayT